MGRNEIGWRVFLFLAHFMNDKCRCWRALPMWTSHYVPRADFLWRIHERSHCMSASLQAILHLTFWVITQINYAVLGYVNYIGFDSTCNLHSLATLLGTPCLYRVGPPFAFRTALILCGIDSKRCWKHSSEILVRIVMIISRSCCRFVGCTFMMRISRSTTSQRCSIELRAGDCGCHLSKVN